MTSLRARLTLSYGSLIAVVLIALSLVLTRLVFAYFAQPTLEAVSLAALDVQLIASLHPDEDARTIEERIKREIVRPGAVVLLPPPDLVSHRRAIIDPRNPGAAPWRFGGDATQSTLRALSIGNLLGLREHPVRLPQNGLVMVAPDMRVLTIPFRIGMWTLGISLFLSISIAWLIAGWIAAKVIAPLNTVTAELRRFAQGDFTPRAVTTRDRSELGKLTAAFNGAAAQVASAFAERVRVEEQMRRFVADAGHELRTPLTVVSGFVDVLEKGGVMNAATRERTFRTLRVETMRMRRLVERLMALAKLDRPDAVELETVDVGEIAAGAVDEVRAARRGEIALGVAPGGALILGDSGELHEAIRNLVDNALKYGAESAVSVEVGRSGERVTVRVSDGGPGIGADDRAHIFERFYRGAHTAGVDGSGLGLAIVERAAERCGGTVRVENGAAGGTSFVLEFPARTAPAPAEPALVL